MTKLAFKKPPATSVEEFIARGDERPSVATVSPIPTAAAAQVTPSKAAPRRRSALRRKGLVQRVSKGELDRVTAYLPAELGQRLRVECAGQRIELSQAVADAVEVWLRKQ